MTARCQRCDELEAELRRLRVELQPGGRSAGSDAGSGSGSAVLLGPNASPAVERELARWLASHPTADAASGFRAGWTRLARFVAPKLREWEARWWRVARENDSLRSRIGSLLMDLSRYHDSG